MSTARRYKSKTTRRGIKQPRTSRRKAKPVLTPTESVNGKEPTTALDERFAKARLKLNARRQRLVHAILDSADETCFLSSR